MDKKALPLMAACKKLLSRLSRIWPQFDLDGYQNVWILKPGAKSRGRGQFLIFYMKTCTSFFINTEMLRKLLLV